jgi:hypothetical protein
MIEEHSHKSTGLRGVEVADTNICLIEGEKVFSSEVMISRI